MQSGDEENIENNETVVVDENTLNMIVSFLKKKIYKWRRKLTNIHFLSLAMSTAKHGSKCR